MITHKYTQILAHLVNGVVILHIPLSAGWLSLALMLIFSIGSPDLGPADRRSLAGPV